MGPHRPGDVLGDRYRLGRHIASGGMAAVWEGTDLELTRRVAIKILHADLAHRAAVTERFHNEALVGARLTHPNVVAVLDALVDDVPVIVMELVRGTTLRDRLDADGPLRPDLVATVGVQIAGALHHAHRAGVVHRDVKPSNILLAADGRSLIADFGIATTVGVVDPIGSDSFVGTARYLSPEQVVGGLVDARSDLYALGIVLHEALIGEAPFDGADDLATARARLDRPAPPIRPGRPAVPPELERIVLHLLARRPDDRPADADLVRRALTSIDGLLPPHA